MSFAEYVCLRGKFRETGTFLGYCKKSASVIPLLLVTRLAHADSWVSSTQEAPQVCKTQPHPTRDYDLVVMQGGRSGPGKNHKSFSRARHCAKNFPTISLNILTKTHVDRYDSLQLMKEEPEAPGVYILCPRSHS